jgi:hypothetical protein
MRGKRKSDISRPDPFIDIGSIFQVKRQSREVI